MIGRVTPPSGKRFDMWVIYRHPRDHPESYVARLWVGNDASIDDFVIADTLIELQQAMIEAGRYRLNRMPGDDPVIVEVWL